MPGLIQSQVFSLCSVPKNAHGCRRWGTRLHTSQPPKSKSLSPLSLSVVQLAVQNNKRCLDQGTHLESCLRHPQQSDSSFHPFLSLQPLGYLGSLESEDLVPGSQPASSLSGSTYWALSHMVWKAQKVISLEPGLNTSHGDWCQGFSLPFVICSGSHFPRWQTGCKL